MRYLLCLWIGCLLLSEAGAQSGYNLSGLITDTAHQPVYGALVQVKALLPGVTVRTVTTDSGGRWQVHNFEQPVFNIQVTRAGYAGYAGDCYFPAARHSIQLKDILLHARSNTLKTVDVTATAPPVVIKQDTVEYNASAYNVRKDADVEDLLKKLPGLKVNRDGTVVAQGKVVTKVKVNGKDFFDGDIRTATRNLPANIVDKVQVVDDYGEAANFTGFRNTE
ncbi:MAG TPA: carboxypeptidase-like regulatory domain-containing protein, partial [Chitinophaga sp.]